ncbi:MAG TPA: TonB-dependent receptor [Opitutaceae bacterium]|nr:TonB-dependent receptor [Opitutaceae bacterium]
MKPQVNLHPLVRCALLLGCAFSAPRLPAQLAPSASPDAATLAKYDKNHNGVLDTDELAAMQADKAKAAATPVVAATGNDEAGENVVQLSPFEVTESDHGYLATSAMSGTRLNSKIEDLAASLSVVTKQQLQDTAAVDINDVFLYEANTEGTQQWTSFSIDRGTVSDDIQANPYGATRMRGLTAANTAIDGFASSLPFDTYNVDSLEISRGPNSSVFGLGQTGGGVNVNPSRANLTRDVTSLGTRGDSYGGYRANFDINRQLVKDKLAIRALGLYDAKGFERDPSYDKTRRLELEATVRPFKQTTIRASFESYRDAYNRPNSTTPRDGISDWIANGKPVYNPLTRSVRFLNGTTPPINNIVTLANENALLPYAIAPTNTAFTQSPSMYIENGQIVLNEINAMPTSTGTGPTSVDATTANPGLHLLTSNTYYNRNTNLFPLFTTAGVTDKSIYDWTSVNITAPNYGKLKAEVANVSFEQIILNTPRNNLAFQAAWQKERTSDNNRSFLGSYGNNGGKLEVDIDINEYLLDGTPNPYFLRPYLGYPRPGFSKSSSATDNYRSVLAYQLNLTNEKNWLRFLGHHNFSLYGEFRSVHTFKEGFTDTISSDESWMSATGVSSSRNANGYRPFVHYLLGDNQGYNVDYGSPGISAPPYSTTLRYYNGVTKQWVNEPVDYAEYYYANRPNRRLLSTVGATWQGFFLNDRVVPTFGIRKDSNRTRDANSAINPTTATDGFYIPPDPHLYGASDWVHNHGKTTQEGIVVKALPWLHLLYNQSNSFTPGSLAYDVNGQPLNDPKGKTHDYGFQFILLDGRLSIRAQQYETVDIGRGDSTINTYIQRTLRMDGGPSAATQYPQTVSDPNLAAWYGSELALKNPTWTVDQVIAQVVKDTGIDPVFIASHYGKTHGDHSDATSHGKEIEITFNPTKYWTLKSTITQALAVNGQVSGEVQDYINSRLPIWTTIKGPNSGTLWWTNTQNSSTTPQTFYVNNVLAPISLLIATQGKQRAQTREWRVNMLSNYRLAGLTENRWLKNLSVGGAYRWEDKAIVGYYGAAPDPDGIVRNYDANRPIWDKARYYIDLNAAYNLRLFGDKVRARLQFNVRNIFENGRLQAVAYNPDGQPFAFRIVDPRQFILSANFDL